VNSLQVERRFTVQHLADELPDLERRLRNWSEWRSGGMSLGRAMQYSAVKSMLRAPGREITPIPLLVVDAEEVERMVKSLPLAWQRALVVWWCHGGSVRQKASRCGCRERAMYQRLALAHRAIWHQSS
jgi:hypothetical protein